MREFLALSVPVESSDDGHVAEPFGQEPPDSEVVEAAVAEFLGAIASAGADNADAEAAYELVEAVVDGVRRRVGAGGPVAGDWLDVLFYLGDQAVERLPKVPARRRIALLATLVGLHVDHCDPDELESTTASPYIALHYCGQALELLDDLDDPTAWQTPLYMLCGNCHAVIAAAGRSDSSIAAVEAVRAFTNAVDVAAEDQLDLVALAQVELANVYATRAAARHEAFEEAQSFTDRDYPRAMAAYRAAVDAAESAIADGRHGAAATATRARLELAGLLLAGRGSPWAAALDTDYSPPQLEPEILAEAAGLVGAVLSANAGTLSDFDRAQAYGLRCTVAGHRLGRYILLPDEPGQEQLALVRGMLADLTDAAAAASRAEIGDHVLAELELRAALLTYFGLRDADQALKLARGCRDRLTTLLLGERSPTVLVVHKSRLNGIHRLLAQLEIDRGQVEEAFAVSTSARATFAVRLLADVDEDPVDLPEPLWKGFVQARRRYAVAVDRAVESWFSLRQGVIPTGVLRRATEATAAARDAFNACMLAAERAAPQTARRLRGDGLNAMEVAGRLAPDHVLVEIHPLVDRTVAYVVSGCGAAGQRTVELPVGPGLGDPEVVGRLLSGWMAPYEDIRQHGLRGVADLERLRGAFSDTFQWFCERFDFSSLATWLTGEEGRTGRRVMSVVAHHPFGFLPLHAVPTVAGRCLIDDFDVRYLPAANFLRADPLPTVGPDTPFVGVSDPRPVPPYRLSYSVCETAVVARHFTTSRMLSGPAATRSAVLDAINDTDVTHLSCHGNQRYIFGSVYNSELILAGRDTLPLAEFFRYLRPSRNRLVVLSACDSGAGDPRGMSDEIFNFPTGLLVGGVRAVVTTLWQVEERATAFLFRTFYRLLVAGDAPDRALRRAQLWLRDATGAELAGVADEMLDVAGAAPPPGLRAWADRYREGPRTTLRPYEDPFFWSAFQLWG